MQSASDRLDALTARLRDVHAVPIRNRGWGYITIYDYRNKCRFEIVLRSVRNDKPVAPFIDMWPIDVTTHIFEDILPFGMDSIRYDSTYPDYMENFGKLLDRILSRIALHRVLTRAALKIQGAFRRAVSDPRHALCRGRLLREFGEILH